MTDKFEDLGDNGWDEELARDLVGSTLLVGLTFLDAEGRLVRREQIFGRVLSVDRGAGIAIAASDGDDPYVIAPVLDAIEPGDLGVYQMTDSDEAVTDPDFIALLTATMPARV